MDEKCRELQHAVFAAVSAILTEDGHAAIDMDAIAKRSGCSHSNILERFESFRSVIEEYTNTRDYWAQTVKLAGAHYNSNLPELRAYVRAIFISHYRLLISNKEMLNFKRWQMDLDDPELFRLMDKKLFDAEDFFRRMASNETKSPSMYAIILSVIYMVNLDKYNPAYAHLNYEEGMVNLIEFWVEKMFTS